MDNKKVGLKDLARKAKVDFIAMAERAWMTAREYKKIYGNDDLRGEFFLLFSEDIIWVVIQLENFYEGYPQHKVHSYFSKLQDSSKVQLVSQFDTINRQSFIALSMFNVDHFVTVLAECLKLKCTNNYKAVVESLSNELFFQTDPNKAKAVFEILYSPYLIRNSLHNNGYIKVLKTDFDVTVRGKKYSFKKNSRIEFADWDNLYNFIDALLDALIEILNHAKVKSISKIPSNYMIEADAQGY